MTTPTVHTDANGNVERIDYLGVSYYPEKTCSIKVSHNIGYDPRFMEQKHEYYHCSKCTEYLGKYPDEYGMEVLFNYCPTCGARVIKQQKSS